MGDQGPTGPTGPAGDPGAVLLPPGAGLKLNILSATIPASGSPTVTFTVTDARGNPLDLLAELQAGTLAPRFTIAARNTDGSYASLYTSTATGKSFYDAAGVQHTPALASATQATYYPKSSGAALLALYKEEGEKGTYTFTFDAAPKTAPTLTLAHDVAIFASRTFDGEAYPASNTYNFIPATGEQVAKREVVIDAACNQCHSTLQAHGTRRGVDVCITCHTSQTVDPETGNTVDFKQMVHKIHRGVQPGDSVTTPYEYEIVGYGQRLMDFAETKFAPPNSVKNCEVCHKGADADNFKNVPSRAACGSCHYDVDFATGAGHSPASLAQADDSLCAQCHTGTAVAKYHSELYDPVNKVLFSGRTLEITIDDATGLAPGAAGTVMFTVKVDGQPYDAKTNPITTLRFTVGGPTKGGFSGAGAPAAVGYIQSANFGGAGAANLTATGTAGQFTAPLPVLAATTKGTVAIGVEAVISETKNDATNTPRTKAYPIKANSIVYRSVDGSPVAPRTQITSAAKCDTCHVALGFHGEESRKDPNYCAMCHNPNNVNDERISRYETDPVTGEAYSVKPASVQLMSMIHKLHAGSALANPITLGAYPPPNATNPAGRPETFAGAFPGDLGNCQTCHNPGTYALPPSTNLPTKVETWACSEDPLADTNDYCTAPYWAAASVTFVPPQTAACTSCHDSDAAKAHTESMTYSGAESCDVCHGKGRQWDALIVHKPMN